MTRSEVHTRKLPIPNFANREEEVEFWDSHDLTDYFEDWEFTPVSLHLEHPLSEPVTLHIDSETWDEVQTLARERDLPPDGLLHVWILERRDAERERRRSAPGTEAERAAPEAVAER
jgi:hypothetical protein